MFQSLGAGLSAVAGLAAVIAALWGGFKWGSHDLEITRSQLQELRDKTALIKKSDEDFRKQLDAALAQQAQAHDARMAELRQRDAQDLAALQTAKGQAEKTAAGLRAQAAATGGRIADLQRQLDAAPKPEDKARLAQQLAEAIASKDVALARASGEDCLRLPVPDDIVKAFNQAALSDRR